MADSTTTAKSVAQRRRILIIAGPNGAGKTTFAREFLLNEATCPTFINADLIAAGMNPFQPEEEAIRAGRLMLKLIDEHVSRGDSFAFETTLSGRAYARKIPLWRKMGYEVVLYFLTLPSADDAIRRVAERVRGGGHNIPTETVRRRFHTGRRNFDEVYQDIVDEWQLFDNRGDRPVLLARKYNT